MLTKWLKKGSLYQKICIFFILTFISCQEHSLRQTNNYDLNLNRQLNDIWDDVKKNCLSLCYAFISIFRIDMSIHLKVLFFFSERINTPASQPFSQKKSSIIIDCMCMSGSRNFLGTKKN